MAGIWTEENRFRTMLEVEIAVAEAMADKGLIPRKSARNIRKKASFKLSEVTEFEKVTKHDVTAFLKSVGKSVGRDARFIHLGLTSSDVLDTGLSLQLVRAIELIVRKVKALRVALKNKAIAYQNTPTIGRTHGVHAEPTTFGLKILVFFQDMGRHLERLERARDNIAYGKISGAVGTNASVSPDIERRALRCLGLEVAPVSTQILQRDRHAEVVAALAFLAAGLEKIAVEIRHLQRTEVHEVEESFTEGQTGSSAMPHKKNPVNSERVSGLARVVRGNLMAALENIALWHERDISHSSVERVILPDSFLLVDFMLTEMAQIIQSMEVYEDQMLANIAKTRGLIFSQRLLLALVEKGLERFEAYDRVQKLAMRVWHDGQADLETLARNDKRIRELLSDGEISEIFQLGNYLKYVDTIFKRALK